MGKYRAGLGLALVMALVLVGCRSGHKPKPQRPDDGSNQLVLRKLQAYMHCLDHSKRVFQTADQYTLNNQVLHRTEDPKKCIGEMIGARFLQPSLPALENAGDAYGAALAMVYRMTSDGEASDKRAAMHDQLLAAFRDFDAIQGRLFDEVARVNREIHLAQLANREKTDGRTLGVRAEYVMLEAEALVRLAATKWDRLPDLDLPALQTQLARLESAAQDMSAYALAEPKEVDGFTGYWPFEDYIRTYIVATRQLVQRARDRVAYSETELLMIRANNETGVVGTPAAAIAAYNSLVDIYGAR